MYNIAEWPQCSERGSVERKSTVVNISRVTMAMFAWRTTVFKCVCVCARARVSVKNDPQQYIISIPDFYGWEVSFFSQRRNLFLTSLAVCL
jgi:hypothetical protein